MMQGTYMIQDAIKQQQQQPYFQGNSFTCPSCYAEDSYPIVLFCGHYICSECVDSKKLSSQEDESNEDNYVLIECNTCDAVTKVSHVSELYLKTKPTLLAQGGQQEPSVLTPTKKNSDKILPAQGISSRSCNQQEQIKNEGCFSQEVFPQFSNKEIDQQRRDFQSCESPEDKKQQIRSKSVSKNNFEGENTIFQTLKTQIEEANICSEHNEEISLFCTAENKLCCVTCVYQTQGKKKRNALPIKQVIGILKEDNQNFQSSCREKTLDIEDALRNCQANKIKLSQAITAYRFQIQAEFQKIQQFLEKRLEESLKHIQSYFEIANKEYEEKQESLQFLKNCMKEYSDLEKAPEALYQETVVYLFSISNMLKNAMKNFAIKTPARKWESLDIIDMSNRQLVQAEISMLGRPKNKQSGNINSQAAQNIAPQPLTPSSRSSNKTTQRSRSPYQSQPQLQQPLRSPLNVNSTGKKNSGFQFSRIPQMPSDSKDSIYRKSLPSRQLHYGGSSSTSPMNRSSCQQQTKRLAVLSPQQEVLSEITQQIEQNILPYFSTVSSNRTSNRGQFHSIISPRTLDVSRDSSLPTNRIPSNNFFKPEEVLNYSSLISAAQQQQEVFQQRQQNNLQQQQHQQQIGHNSNQILHSFAEQAITHETTNDFKNGIPEVTIRAQTLSEQPLDFTGNSFAANRNFPINYSNDNNNKNNFLSIEKANNSYSNLNNNAVMQTEINQSPINQISLKKPAQKMISSSFIKNSYTECLFVSSSSGGVATTDSATRQIVSGGSSANNTTHDVAGNLASSTEEHSQFKLQTAGNGILSEGDNQSKEEFDSQGLKLFETLQNHNNDKSKKNMDSPMPQIQGQIHQQQQFLEKQLQRHQENQKNIQNIINQKGNKQVNKRSNEINGLIIKGQISDKQEQSELDEGETIGLIQSEILENKHMQHLRNQTGINNQNQLAQQILNYQQMIQKQQIQQQQDQVSQKQLQHQQNHNFQDQHQLQHQQQLSKQDQESFCRFEVSCSTASQRVEDKLINCLEPLQSQMTFAAGLENSFSPGLHNQLNKAQEQQNNIQFLKNTFQGISNHKLYSESLILSNEIAENEQQVKVLPESVKHTRLLYRLSSDGASSQVFHKKCDGQGPSLTLVKANGQHIFGYFMPISFTRSDQYSTSDKCYIFTLQNSLGIAPTRFNIRTEKKFIAIYQNAKSPCLGSTLNSKQDLIINFDSPEKSCSNLGYAFKIDQGMVGDQILAGSYTDWQVEDIEVFALSY